MVDCDPQLNDTNELLRELNKSNGLFKFVRIMREKFQAAVAHGMTLCFCFYVPLSYEPYLVTPEPYTAVQEIIEYWLLAIPENRMFLHSL